MEITLTDENHIVRRHVKTLFLSAKVSSSKSFECLRVISNVTYEFNQTLGQGQINHLLRYPSVQIGVEYNYKAAFVPFG